MVGLPYLLSALTSTFFIHQSLHLDLSLVHVVHDGSG